jgi:hypothetical protein
MRKLQRAAAKKSLGPHADKAGVSLQSATRINNARERRLAQMQERIPPLPFGVQKADYIKALAHMRRTYPEKSGRALHDLAVEACVAFEQERQVQRVLAGGKS